MTSVDVFIDSGLFFAKVVFAGSMTDSLIKTTCLIILAQNSNIYSGSTLTDAWSDDMLEEPLQRAMRRLKKDLLSAAITQNDVERANYVMYRVMTTGRQATLNRDDYSVR